MLRSFLCAVFALLLVAGGLFAGEVKGKIKKVDAEKNVVTVTTEDGKDVEFMVSDTTKLLNGKGADIKQGLKAKGFKEGANVTITCEKKDGKEVCTQIQLGGKKPNP